MPDFPLDQEPGQGKQPGKGKGLVPRPGPGGGFFIYVLIGLLVLLVVVFLMDKARRATRVELDLWGFTQKLQTHRVKELTVKENKEIVGLFRTPLFADEKHDQFWMPMNATLAEEVGKLLSQYIAEVRKYNGEAEEFNKTAPEGQKRSLRETMRITLESPNEFLFALIQFGVIFVLGGLLLWWFMARQMRSAAGAGGMLSFGKARVRLYNKEESHITFDDVAGIDEAKEEVQEIVEFLKHPPKYRRLGGRIPRGVLLVGPPGCGKTLLAKAIAGEADVPFFNISGSDFIEMFVGVGASRVRDLFRQAKDSAPCIIFLDEIDAVGRRRASDLHGATIENAQTLNAILVEMDGLETDDTVIVMAATNRPDILDPALLRPGRFDRQITVDYPDLRGRESILKVHAKKYKLASNVDLRQMARGTPMFSGAELETLLNEAALLATRRGRKAVAMDDLEEARDKVRWGRQRKSRKMTESDRTVTAYHESGHAFVAKSLPEAEPLHKVSIIPTGMSLGMTMSLPEQDRYTYQKSYMVAEITMLMAGRVAEETFCGDSTTGAQHDLDRATTLARNMVTRWGMSDVVGPVSYLDIEEPGLQGLMRGRQVSEAMAVKIDEEVSRIIREAYARAKTIITENRDACERLAKTLLRYEVLYAADVDKILAGKELDREPGAELGSVEESAEKGSGEIAPPRI